MMYCVYEYCDSREPEVVYVRRNDEYCWATLVAIFFRLEDAVAYIEDPELTYANFKIEPFDGVGCGVPCPVCGSEPSTGDYQ